MKLCWVAVIVWHGCCTVPGCMSQRRFKAFTLPSQERFVCQSLLITPQLAIARICYNTNFDLNQQVGDHVQPLEFDSRKLGSSNFQLAVLLRRKLRPNIWEKPIYHICLIQLLPQQGFILRSPTIRVGLDDTSPNHGFFCGTYSPHGLTTGRRQTCA